ncbi:MAG: hypothetical protein M5E90_01160 [Asgard group archaeon]|nr:hypothetical protein [Asgard group archaeon]
MNFEQIKPKRERKIYSVYILSSSYSHYQLLSFITNYLLIYQLTVNQDLKQHRSDQLPQPTIHYK